MKKNKYEISLWEDRLVPQTGEGQSIVPEHYEEEKVCIIGSDTMTSQARALEPKLVRNVNGTNKLTFKLYYTYIDNETGKRVQNPFISLLVNERKVKCKWEDEWYDFVIKGIQEDSNGKTITYTCEDLYINELSKTGFSLEFDQKLNNNQGTAQELAKKVLEGTDWVVDTGSSDHILQTIEEPLYKALLKKNITVKNEKNKDVTIELEKDPQTGELIYIPIYLFYSVVQEKKSYVQFIYNTSYETESNSQLLKENNCYSIDMKAEGWEAFVREYLDGNPIFSDDYRGKRLVRKQLQEFNSALNRNCYVYEDYYKTSEVWNKTEIFYIYDEETKDYIRANEENSKGQQLYKKRKVLGYSTVEYKDPTVVLNLISNSKEFVDTNGWQGALSWELYPLFFGEEKLNYSYTSTTYLRNTTEKPILVFNSGLQDSAGYLEDGLQPGQRYFLRIRGYNGEPKNNTTLTDGISFHIYDYFTALSSENSIPVHNEEDYCEKIGDTQLEDYYFITSDVEKIEGKSYYIRNTETKKYDPFPDGAVFPGNEPLYEKGQILQIEFEVIRARPKKEITAGYFGEHIYTDSNGNSQTETSIARPGIFISLPANSWIQEVQFYQRVEEYNGSVIHLGDFDTQSVGKTYYKYFFPNDAHKKEEDIKYIYYGLEKQTQFIEYYGEPDSSHALYEKIRSITAKNSNRFNILQNIAETFQCWVRFKIKHNKDGRIVYENGVPKKTVYFKEKIGEDLGYGFVYGIDLKTISRSIDSNQLTTKVVVAPNTSEYAENGICRIADADLNENGENYILDFGYYISQGLLNSGELNKYLYLPDNNGNSGFYVELKNKNKEYNEIVEKLTPKKTELSKQTSLQTIYDQYVSNSVTEITTLQNNLCKLVGFDNFDDEKILDYLKTHSDNQEAKNIYSNLITQQHKRESFQASLKLIEASVNELTEVVKGYEEDLEAKANEKKVLENAFYQKFSRFIQEGSWTSQDYIDPNLYYLDARSVAYTSSRPKISYNISVIRLNALDEYKGKKFNVGDISFIEDKEFFGYIKGEDAWKTPYHEKVLISESTSWFDSPEKDTFTIQNYKTQFEDLFQRITATTQSLQYSTGEYNRASSIVEGKGVINTETLQNSININNELVFKSQNEEIFQDSTGLTLTDKRDPSKRTKLTSGGLFISTDGGVTWKNAVRGEGVATQYLTSGSINTNNIAIYDGAHASFRWDKYGINAYDVNRDENNNLIGIIRNNFVRFDQYGIYGILGADSTEVYVPQDQNQIWEDGRFGLTWDGFFLKNKEANQQIEISTKNDICITTPDKVDETKTIEKIKIGRLGEENGVQVFGLRLKNDDGITTLETDNQGNLWLRDELQISDLVKIGNLTNDEVFNANNKFIIKNNGSVIAEDGFFKGIIEANSGSFKGKIEATSGRIGGLEVLVSDDLTSPPFATISENQLILNTSSNSNDGEVIPSFIVQKEENSYYTLTEDTIVYLNKTYYSKAGDQYIEEAVNEDDNPSDLGLYEKVINFTQVLYTDSDGNLTFGGNLEGATGTFSGELRAATGTFSGELKAPRGEIGGFLISEEGRLESVNKFTNNEGTYSAIVLDGQNGKITANNIELGDGAVISNRITFKDQNGISAYLQNPSNFEGVILKAGNLELNANGLLKLGDISFSGELTNPTIKSSKWTIDKDKADFNNVIARGGTIENVVFKNSTVQASGGISIFKPSFSANLVSQELSEDKKYKVILELDSDRIDLKVDDVVLVNKYEGKIIEINNKEITIQTNYTELLEFSNETITIVKLYHINKDSSNNIIDLSNSLLIGINSTENNSSITTNDCHLFRSGITITAPIIRESEIIYPEIPNLFIGDLSSIKPGYSGYGLYGDNVFLNGTLTTKVPSDDNPTYAGINTITGVSSKQDSSEKIVFWAGSIDDTEDSIQESPFQVTDKGNLFAKRGYFTDSVFTDSTIEGSIIRGADIYTANIHGWDFNGSQSGGLNIYDTSNGIMFKDKADVTLFSIKDSGIIGEVPIISINNNKIDFCGYSLKLFNLENKENDYTEFTNNKISKFLKEGDTGRTTSALTLGKEEISCEIENYEKFIIKQNESILSTNFTAKEDVKYSLSMEYRKIIEQKASESQSEDWEIGYDLYIKEEKSKPIFG